MQRLCASIALMLVLACPASAQIIGSGHVLGNGTGSPAAPTDTSLLSLLQQSGSGLSRAGNTAILATVNGSIANGHCRSTDSNGNDVDAGGPCGTGTGSGTVTSGLTGQFAYYPTSGASVSGSNMFNMTSTGNWYQNSGAYVQRFNDRMLVGGATIGDGDSPNTTQDWLTAYQNSFGIPPSCPVAELCALNYSNSAAGDGAGSETFVAGARSGWLTEAGPTPLASVAIGINDSEAWVGTGTISGTTFHVSTTTSGTVAIGQTLGSAVAPQLITGGSSPNWTLCNGTCTPGNISSPSTMYTSWATLVEGFYGEAHRLLESDGQTNASEFEIRNLGNEVTPSPYQMQINSPYIEQLTDASILGCGAGESGTGQGPCTNALLIINNGAPVGGVLPTNTAFDDGIVFASSSIKTQGDGSIRAINMTVGMDILWWNSGNAIAGSMTTTTGGALSIAANTGLDINGIAGANCSAAPDGSFHTVFGIVTAC